MQFFTQSEINKLEKELAQINTRKGKIVNILKNSSSYMLKKIDKKAKEILKNNSLYKNETSGKIYNIVDIKQIGTIVNNKIKYSITWKEYLETKTISTIIHDIFPFEETSIEKVLTLGMKKISNKESQSIIKNSLLNIIKEKEDEILKLKEQYKSI